MSDHIEELKGLCAEISTRLSADGMGAEISAKHSGAPIRLIDEEGNPIVEIPVALARVMAGQQTEWLSQADCVEIAAWFRSYMPKVRANAHALGVAAGRKAIVDTVHELLGVDTIAKALYEIRGE